MPIKKFLADINRSGLIVLFITGLALTAGMMYLSLELFRKLVQKYPGQIANEGYSPRILESGLAVSAGWMLVILFLLFPCVALVSKHPYISSRSQWVTVVLYSSVIPLCLVLLALIQLFIV